MLTIKRSARAHSLMLCQGEVTSKTRDKAVSSNSSIMNLWSNSSIMNLWSKHEFETVHDGNKFMN